MTDERFAFVQAAMVDQASSQRLQVALEYAAAGWEPRGRLGFLFNAIAFDALYGDPKVGVGNPSGPVSPQGRPASPTLRIGRTCSTASVTR